MMKRHKILWIGPVVVVAVLIAFLLFFARKSGNAPFTYTLF